MQENTEENERFPPEVDADALQLPQGIEAAYESYASVVRDIPIVLVDEEAAPKRKRLRRSLGTTKCCNCNGENARCANCRCVKNGTGCTTCLPRRHQKCRNPNK